MISLDLAKFWLFLIPTVLLYLLTDRSIKLFLLIPCLFIFLDLIFIRLKSKTIVNKNVAVAFALFCVVTSFSILSGAIWGQEKLLFRDVFIIGSSIAMFMVIHSINKAPQMLFCCFSAAYIMILAQKGIGLSDISQFFSYQIFLPSSALTEYDFGIVFGLFTVHFFISRLWMWFVPSMVISLMVSKRALLAGFLASAIWWIILGLNKHISFRFKIASLFLLFLVFAIQAFFITEIGNFLLHIFDIDYMNIGRFLMGRNELTLALRDHIDFASVTTFFGHGPGAADTYIGYKGVGWGPISETFNPHNDYLKIIFDYGIFGYFLFFLILILFYGKSSKGMALLVYTMTVFCFDNALIFMTFHIVSGFICNHYLQFEPDGVYTYDRSSLVIKNNS